MGICCRAGTTTPFFFGSTISTEQANYDGSSTWESGRKGQYRAQTVAVDEFRPNSFGLFQMHGNVREWC
jgi:formylglycine-generating enzyme required for sulfatase activity